MTNRALSFLMSGVALFALVGCSDPLVGKWESKEDKDVDLEIERTDDGYRGEGHISACVEIDGDWACVLCPIEFEAEESGSDSWDVSGEFTGECRDFGDFDGIECELNSAGDELECELPGDGGSIEYERDE